MTKHRDIFSYVDFRIYLSDWFDAKKKVNPRYSHRMFSRAIGQKSPSFLSDVIKGRRKLTAETTGTVGRALKLNASSLRFFRLLVDMQQANDDQTKERLMRKIMSWRKRQGATSNLEGEAFDILSNWEYTAVYELMKRSDFRLDPVWIGQTIQPSIPARKARAIVETLFTTGLVVKDGKGGLKTKATALRTTPIVQGIAVRNYHRGMLQLAQESMQRFPNRRRHLLGMTMAVPTSKVQEVKRRLDEMFQELTLLCEEDAESKEEVIQINLNMFPLAKPSKHSK